MIEAKEINFAYRRGIPVLFDINCKIEDGEFVALLGHNGRPFPVCSWRWTIPAAGRFW